MGSLKNPGLWPKTESQEECALGDTQASGNVRSVVTASHDILVSHRHPPPISTLPPPKQMSDMSRKSDLHKFSVGGLL